MKEIAVIPARLNSKRFPNKILYDLNGLPMIEHVRRRVMMAKKVKDVIVATCDIEIRNVLESYGAKVVMTSKNHRNGTTRVAEAIANISCRNVILIQGDEPLLLPRYLDKMIETIRQDNLSFAWNATGPIGSKKEIYKKSIVKASVYEDNILYCFRERNKKMDFRIHLQRIRKILGLIAFKKDFLMKLIKMKQTLVEKFQSIEQMRIIENGYLIRSVPFDSSQPSINEPFEVGLVWEYVQNNEEQKNILEDVFNFNVK